MKPNNSSLKTAIKNNDFKNYGNNKGKNMLDQVLLNLMLLLKNIINSPKKNGFRKLKITSVDKVISSHSNYLIFHFVFACLYKHFYSIQLKLILYKIKTV